MPVGGDLTVCGALRCYVVMWLQAHFSAKLGKDKHVWLDRVRAVASETLTQVTAVRSEQSGLGAT
jgi:hypothetical protein